MVNSDKETEMQQILTEMMAAGLALIMKIVWISDYFMTHNIQEFILENYIITHINHQSALIFINEAIKKVKSISASSSLSLPRSPLVVCTGKIMSVYSIRYAR